MLGVTQGVGGKLGVSKTHYVVLVSSSEDPDMYVSEVSIDGF